MSRRVTDDDEQSYRPPKLPKTMRERDSAKRLIVVLEQASLETVKVCVWVRVWVWVWVWVGACGCGCGCACACGCGCVKSLREKPLCFQSRCSFCLR